MKVICNPACGYHSLIIFQSLGGRNSGRNIERDEKARREASLGEICFSYWELIFCLNFSYHFWWAGDRFKMEDTHRKTFWPAELPLESEGNFLIHSSWVKIPVGLVVFLSWSSKLRPLGKTFSPSLNAQRPFKVTVKWFRHLGKYRLPKLRKLKRSYVLINVNSMRPFLLCSAHDRSDWRAKRAAKVPVHFCGWRLACLILGARDGELFWAHFDQSDLLWDDSCWLLGDYLGGDGDRLRTRRRSWYLFTSFIIPWLGRAGDANFLLG